MLHIHVCVNINNYMLFLGKKSICYPHEKRNVDRWPLTVFFCGFFFGGHIHVYTWLFLNSDSITKTEFIALLKLDDRFRP